MTGVWISIVASLLLVMNTILYFKGFAKQSRAFKIFCFYLLFYVFIQIGSMVVAKVLHLNNLYFSNFYLLGQFVLLSIFYGKLYRSSLIRLLMLPVVAFLGYQYVTDPTLLFRYNPLGISITQTILVVYAVGYLYRSLSGRNEFIIVNIGILFYLLSSTLIFASGNLVLDLEIDEATRFTLININRVLIVMFQVLIFVEWYRNYRRSNG